ncbi:DNA-binding protein [Candidatus Desantisbacteria bacterium]|nr:DNA-binding protein [Candidatus Desantisbacteria bacterium]
MHLLLVNKIKNIIYRKIANRSLLLPAMCILFFILNLSLSISAENISANLLIEKFKDYDRKNVTLLGEAIGDKMARKGGVWINICDSTGTAMGVWFRPEDAGKINVLGSYNFRGDLISVTGIYNRACLSHKGEIDLHAVSFKIIQRGYPIKHPVSKIKFQLFIILAISSIVLIFIWKKYFKHKIEIEGNHLND